MNSQCATANKVATLIKAGVPFKFDGGIIEVSTGGLGTTVLGLLIVFTLQALAAVGVSITAAVIMDKIRLMIMRRKTDMWTTKTKKWTPNHDQEVQKRALNDPKARKEVVKTVDLMIADFDRATPRLAEWSYLLKKAAPKTGTKPKGSTGQYRQPVTVTAAQQTIVVRVVAKILEKKYGPSAAKAFVAVVTINDKYKDATARVDQAVRALTKLGLDKKEVQKTSKVIDAVAREWRVARKLFLSATQFLRRPVDGANA